jgi:phage gp29-like protein
MAWYDGLTTAFRAAVGRPRNIEGELSVHEGASLSMWPQLDRNRRDAIYTLTNQDELLRRQGFKVYRDMLADDTVKACLAFKKALVHGRRWTITPAGGKDATAQQKRHADFVLDALQAVRMNRIIREMLTAFNFGFSVGEIIWEVKPLGHEEELKVVLKDIKFRAPDYIWIDMDPHGNIVRFRQEPGVAPGVVRLDPDKVIHYAYGGEHGNHYGVSDLRACYAAWWSKKFITQFWNVFLERFGQPLMMMKYPHGADSTLKEALKAILSSLSSRSDILVPEGVEIDLVEATRAGSAGYGEALNYCDVRISRAILVPALLGMGVDVKRGSDSQSRLHLRVLMKVANDSCIDISAEMKQKLIEPMIRMNFPEYRPGMELPDFEFLDYGEYEGIEIVDAAINMFNSGMLDADQGDINFLRASIGLPVREEGDEDEVMRAPPPPVGGSPNDPNATGAGAGKNNNRATKGPSEKTNTAKT